MQNRLTGIDPAGQFELWVLRASPAAPFTLESVAALRLPMPAAPAALVGFPDQVIDGALAVTFVVGQTTMPDALDGAIVWGAALVQVHPTAQLVGVGALTNVPQALAAGTRISLETPVVLKLEV